MTLLSDTERLLDQLQTMELTGRVAQVQGLGLRVSDLSLPVGAEVRVEAQGGVVRGEVVGFDEDQTIVMLFGETAGIRRNDRVVGASSAALAPVGESLLGRVVDGVGRPLDGKGPVGETTVRPLRPEPVDPMARVPIDQPLGTGVRALDAMLTVGRGQRLGIFSGPGVGKSTLLGMMARQTEADVSVVALIGERGRELRDFLEHGLGPEGMERTVVVTATADEPALMRMRAAMQATAVAEHFREQGLDVLLVMDSVTRFCQAARQVGLASGEPPATKGYTPSVFAALPTLLERSGRSGSGSVTGFYAILVEGDDMTEPIADACRGILDGHVVLSRDLADRGHRPAIDVPQSVSRVANQVIDERHQAARDEVARLIHGWREVEELVNIGAYASGSNPRYDLAIEMREVIDTLLRQRPDEAAGFEESKRHLLELHDAIRQRARQLGQQ